MNNILKINEICVGNFIYDDDLIPSKITAIAPHDNSVRADTPHGCVLHIDIYRNNKTVSKDYVCDFHACKGIPIEKEWLVKLGFVEKHFSRINKYVWVTPYYMFNNFLWYFDLRSEGYLSFCVAETFVTDVFQVHQLQNLYQSLTHNQLTIA